MEFQIFAQLLNSGVVVAMLGWFALRLEPKLDAVSYSMYAQSRALLLYTLAVPDLPQHHQEQAELLLAEIEAHMPPHPAAERGKPAS